MLTTKSSPALAHVGLLVIFFGLAIALTWPTGLQLATHLPGDGGDDPAIAWNLWWAKYALLNSGQNPFHTTMMFYPVGINLAFYTLTLLNGVAALPLLLNLGVVTASNLHLLFTFTAGGYGTFLLIRYCLVRMAAEAAGSRLLWWSAAIGGIFYAFAGSKLFYVALGQFNIASNHWVPFALLYFLRMHDRPHRLKNAAMAGLFTALQAWSELTYASFIVVFWTLYWLYGLATAPAQWRTGRQLGAVLLMGGVFAAGISPILLHMIPAMLTEGDFLVEGEGFATAFSADLLGFIIPTMHHPLLGTLVSETGITAFDKAQHIYIGGVLLSLTALAAVTGWQRHPQLRFWLLAGGIFALLCLGPTITANGHNSRIPGPFLILQQLPFFKGNRYPSRYSVMLMLSLSVPAAYSLLWLGRRIRQQPALPIALIAVLFLFEHLSIPLPQSNMQIPAVYQTIAADPANVTVLDIPFAWRNGFRITGALTTQFMFGQFYQTHHQKPMLQGNTSRNPRFKFQYFARAPIIKSLLALETGKPLPPQRQAADQAIAAEVLRFFNIKYLVVRPEPDNPFGHHPQAAIPYIETTFPVEKIHADETITLYRVDAQPPAAPIDTLITTSEPLAPLYFGEGWGVLTPGHPVAAQRRQVRLLLPLTGAAQQLTLRLRLPDDRISFGEQTVSLELNGWQSAAQPVEPRWRNIAFDLPPQAIRPGLNDVWLHFSQTASLQPIPQTPLIDLTVQSAGEDVGGFGYIFANGYNISLNNRGYNVASINAAGSPTVASFDTHLNPTAAAGLTAFLSNMPDNTIVAIAAADEASANLSDVAVQALQTAAGASAAGENLRGCFRCSHAIISFPECTGDTIEALDPLAPVSITTNLGLTEPQIAAVVEWIKLENGDP